MRAPEPLPPVDPIWGWKGIAEYLQVDESTVHRWRKRTRNPMPCYKTNGKPWASPFELQVWLRQCTIPGATDVQGGE